MSLYYPLVLAKLLVSLIETFLKNSKSGYELEGPYYCLAFPALCGMKQLRVMPLPP